MRFGHGISVETGGGGGGGWDIFPPQLFTMELNSNFEIYANDMVRLDSDPVQSSYVPLCVLPFEL